MSDDDCDDNCDPDRDECEHEHATVDILNPFVVVIGFSRVAAPADRPLEDVGV